MSELSRDELRAIADEIGEECMTVGDGNFGAKTFSDIAYMVLVDRLESE